MKKVILMLGTVLFTMSLFSCTTTELAEEAGIEELGTVGEEGEILPPEEDEGGV